MWCFFLVGVGDVREGFLFAVIYYFLVVFRVGGFLLHITQICVDLTQDHLHTG